MHPTEEHTRLLVPTMEDVVNISWDIMDNEEEEEDGEEEDDEEEEFKKKIGPFTVHPTSLSIQGVFLSGRPVALRILQRGPRTNNKRHCDDL